MAGGILAALAMGVVQCVADVTRRWTSMLTKARFDVMLRQSLPMAWREAHPAGEKRKVPSVMRRCQMISRLAIIPRSSCSALWQWKR